MALELPDLPYAYDALGTYMSAETLEFHHDKHHNAYVVNGNKLHEGSGLEDNLWWKLSRVRLAPTPGCSTMRHNITITCISGTG